MQVGVYGTHSDGSGGKKHENEEKENGVKLFRWTWVKARGVISVLFLVCKFSVNSKLFPNKK